MRIFNILVRSILIINVLLLKTIFGQIQLPDNRGKDFWLAFPSNWSDDAKMSFFISSSELALVTIEIPGTMYSAKYTVTPGEIQTVELPKGAYLEFSDLAMNKGIHVISDKEITIYGLNQLGQSTDAFLALPTDVLGTHYIVQSYKNAGYVNNGRTKLNASSLSRRGTEFAVVATEDTTMVSITPSVTCGNRLKGQTYAIALDKGQVYQLLAQKPGDDLSGTFITSNKPVAVFSGHKCANIPVGYDHCDHLVEQLPSVDTWGKKFVVMPLATRKKGDTFRFLASEDQTAVRINSTTVYVMRGQFHEQILTNPATIVADKPILVMQYSNSTSFDNVVSDPFMLVIPPIEQYQNYYIMSTPEKGFSKNFINIVTPASGVGKIVINGLTIPADSFKPLSVGETSFYGLQYDVKLTGTQVLKSTLPFGAFMYGFDKADSYGYSGGSAFVNLSQLTGIVALSDSNRKVALPEKNVTEYFKITTSTGRKFNLSGYTVNFRCKGANPSDGIAYTDTAGQVAFTYPLTKIGRDTIVATVGSFSTTISLEVTTLLPILVEAVSGDENIMLHVTDSNRYEYPVVYSLFADTTKNFQQPIKTGTISEIQDTTFLGLINGQKYFFKVQVDSVDKEINSSMITSATPMAYFGGEVAGTVYKDNNADSVYNAEDEIIKNVKLFVKVISLDDTAKTIVRTADVNSENGQYLITPALFSGKYRLILDDNKDSSDWIPFTKNGWNGTQSAERYIDIELPADVRRTEGKLADKNFGLLKKKGFLSWWLIGGALIAGGATTAAVLLKASPVDAGIGRPPSDPPNP
ncbi:IgGFc-binding protein [bacterium]|nr:IgGFc-binding protein [bacterium]